MPRLVVEHLTKSFKEAGGKTVLAVNDANLSVEDGEFLVVVGPSGSGKTTLLRLIAGLETVSSGSIAMDGRIINNVPPKDRDIAMVFQQHALYPHMSLRENIAFGLRIRKVPRADADRLVDDAANLLGLAHCLDRKPGNLSGGECQRASLGRAIVLKPKLFLFDEPLSNLDGPTRVQLRRELLKIQRNLKATVVCVTHDQAEATAMGDRIAVMKDGVIQQVAAPMELYRNPANVFVAGFIGSPPMNLLRGKLVPRDKELLFEATGIDGTSDRLSIQINVKSAPSLESFGGREIILGVRPEDILNKTDADGSFQALVEAVEHMGSEAHLFVKCCGQTIVSRAPADLTLRPQANAMFGLDLEKVRFFDVSTGNRIA